jgi:N-acyl amino acid synthase FeeM
MNATAGALPSFSDRVLRFLERVEHRIARTDREREEVFRLRHDAYVRNGLMRPRGDGKLFDERYDNALNAWIAMTIVGGELAGSVRVSVGVGAEANLPCVRVFPDVVGPRLAAAGTAVEYTRLSAKLSLSSAHPELPYAIMRPGYMAAEQFDADYAITTPRLEHMPFYRRVFEFDAWCEPRPYPGLTAKFACMGVDFHKSRGRVEARYPFYKSTRAEREALFGRRGMEIDGFPCVGAAARGMPAAAFSSA